MSRSGSLFVVATPIGHLGDMTYRAVRVLTDVDWIAAEDTRHSQKLLKHYQISTPMLALHQHNEQKITDDLIARIRQGENVALISDAGTPLIHDPGQVLVDKVLAKDLQVVPVPGPCAAIAALSISGQATKSFLFLGFLPSKQIARQKTLTRYAHEAHTLIFYEAPHRMLESVADMECCFGADRMISIAKELTKAYESVFRGTVKDCRAWLEGMGRVRGEYVMVVSGHQHQDDESYHPTLKTLLSELPLKQAVQLTSEITGVARNTIYQQALLIQKIECK